MVCRGSCHQHRPGIRVWPTSRSRVDGTQSAPQRLRHPPIVHDVWGAYERHLDPEQHGVGKRNTQKIERKNLNFRTWIKRLARQTICFPKCEVMHDTVIGRLINTVEFKRDIHAKLQI